MSAALVGLEAARLRVERHGLTLRASVPGLKVAELAIEDEFELDFSTGDSPKLRLLYATRLNLALHASIAGILLLDAVAGFENPDWSWGRWLLMAAVAQALPWLLAYAQACFFCRKILVT